jgi:putative intracellular protease/amidase
MAFRWNWSERPDDLAVAVFAHRAVARGHEISLTDDGYSGPDALAAAAARCALNGVSGTAAGTRLRLPRIVLYAGAAIGYPYYAYYSHALWSLGLAYRRASAAQIAQGILDHADVLIIPGGFATWGLDRIEEVTGVDQAICGFIARGGSCIGSCGGAFYLSEGRPGWLNAIDAKPRFTHEYLLTGTCLLNVRLSDPALRRGLPETIELPYYHGPVYDVAERGSSTLATFGEHVLANRLFINNPLDPTRYGDIMRNRVAILSGRTPALRVIGFSAHPEMGEFLRKAIVLDGYVRHYLPLRGAKTMQETLRFYAKENCMAFRLILNAAIMLGAFDCEAVARQEQPDAVPDAPISDISDISEIDAAWHDGLAHLRARLPADEEPGIAALIETELAALEAEWQDLRISLPEHANDQELQRTLSDAAAAIAQPTSRTCPEAMVLLEFPVRLLAARSRITRFDSILETT